MHSVKRASGLRVLSSDHHLSLVVAKRCQRVGEITHNGETSAIGMHNALIEYYESHLRTHFELEEKYLVPLLATNGQKQIADAIVSQHCAIYEAIFSGDVTTEAIYRAGLLLETHVRFEERTAFETIQRICGEEMDFEDLIGDLEKRDIDNSAIRKELIPSR